MPDLRISSKTDDQLTLLAGAWGVTKEAVVVRLITEFKLAQRLRLEGTNKEAGEGFVKVYGVYKGHRVEGTFDPGYKSITITEPREIAGHCTSVSKAVAKVILHFNPGVAPIRSGWNFWMIEGTNTSIRSLQRHL